MLSNETTKLGRETGVSFDGHAVTFYDVRGYSAVTNLVLDEETVENFIQWYTDGLCPICLTEIPEGGLVCNDCFEIEARNRTANKERV